MKTALLTSLPLLLACCAPALANTPESLPSPRNFLEIDAGRGFAGKAVDIFGAGTGLIIPTDWVGVKMRPFTELQAEAIGVQLGLHSSDDMAKNVACRAMPEIAGRRFCSTNNIEYNAGSHFFAFYSGVQAEIVELLSREPKPMQVYLGAGASYVQSVAFDSATVPYSSVELGYQLETQLQARAGMFLSVPRDYNGVGVAAPEVTLQYRF